MQSFRHCINNTCIGLMQNEQVNIRHSKSGIRQCFLDALRHPSGGEPVHFLSIHLNIMFSVIRLLFLIRFCRRSPCIRGCQFSRSTLQDSTAGAVGVQCPAQNACWRYPFLLRRLLHPFPCLRQSVTVFHRPGLRPASLYNYRSGTVSEQDAAAPVRPVHQL